MNTQDTTLPPLPEQERAEFEAWAKRRCFDLTILEDDESDEYKELETESAWEAWQARAAIAAQAPQPSPLVAVGEDGEGQENHCPECGAEPGQMCSDEEGMEHGRKVHAVRQAQQASQEVSDDLLTGQAQHLISALMSHGLLAPSMQEDQYLKLWDVVKRQLKCVNREGARATVKESLTPHRALNELVDESERLGLYGGAQQAQGAPAGMVLFPAAARSDVLTAAGLVRHGGRCGALADRLGQAVHDSWAAAPQAEPQTPAPAHHAELDYDAWECDRCHGKGWHWVERDGVDWRDKVSTKEHCEQCNGIGWCGPEASKLAEAELGKVLGEYRDASEEFDAEVLARFIKSHPKHAAALRRYSMVQLTFVQPTREEIEAEEIPAPAAEAEPQPEREPLSPEQIEALPFWSHFVGLFPATRQEITRAIEAAHGIGTKGGGTK